MARVPTAALAAALALTSAITHARAQAFDPAALGGGGAGPMTLQGGAADRRASGTRPTVYARPVAGGLTRPAAAPRGRPDRDGRAWRAPVTLPEDVPGAANPQASPAAR